MESVFIFENIYFQGMEGYRQQINNLMELSAYFTQRIRETEGYELVIDPVFALS